MKIEHINKMVMHLKDNVNFAISKAWMHIEMKHHKLQICLFVQKRGCEIWESWVNVWKGYEKSHLGGQNTKKPFNKGQLSFCLSVTLLVQVCSIKVTWYLWGKNSRNLQLLDILTCNSANIPSLMAFCQILKRWFISKLQTKTSRSCIFSLFLAHKYQVSLRDRPIIRTVYSILLLKGYFWWKNCKNLTNYCMIPKAASFLVYYIHFDRYADSMGSDQPPLAAGK